MSPPSYTSVLWYICVYSTYMQWCICVCFTYTQWYICCPVRFYAYRVETIEVFFLFQEHKKTLSCLWGLYTFDSWVRAGLSGGVTFK